MKNIFGPYCRTNGQSPWIRHCPVPLPHLFTKFYSNSTVENIYFSYNSLCQCRLYGEPAVLVCKHLLIYVSNLQLLWQRVIIMPLLKSLVMCTLESLIFNLIHKQFISVPTCAKIKQNKCVEEKKSIKKKKKKELLLSEIPCISLLTTW